MPQIPVVFTNDVSLALTYVRDNDGLFISHEILKESIRETLEDKPMTSYLNGFYYVSCTARFTLCVEKLEDKIRVFKVLSADEYGLFQKNYYDFMNSEEVTVH